MADHPRGVIDLLRHPWAKIVLESLGIIIFFWLITRLSEVITPVLVGLVLAYILDPVVSWISRHGIRRRFAVSLVFGTGVLAMLAVLAIGVPKAWREGRLLYQGAVEGDRFIDLDGDGKWEEGEPLTRDLNGNGRYDPPWLRRAHDALLQRGLIGESEPPKPAAPAPKPVTPAPKAVTPAPTPADQAPAPAEPPAAPAEQGATSADQPATGAASDAGAQRGGDEDDFDPQAWLKASLRDLSKRFRSGDRNAFNKLFEVIGRIGYWGLLLLLIPTYGYFFSLNLPLVSRTIIEHVPLAHRDRTLRIFAEINQVVGAFFRGRVAICGILAIVAGVGFAIAQVPSWLVMAGVMGIATAIPLAPILVLVPAALLLFLNGADQWQYFAIVGTWLVVQGLEPVLVAVIMGAGVEMHPVILIVAILAFHHLFGGAGAILAVPLAATARILLREFLYPHLRRMAGLDRGATAPA
jgi:predicted PurR-regulated permease PerM